jgi:amidase
MHAAIETITTTDLRKQAFSDDALGDHDAVGLAELLARRELSARDLVVAAIARAEKVEPALHAIASEHFERALRGAADRAPGFFSGVPTFIKDNTPVAGMTTNHGSAAVHSQPAREHGAYAKQYLAQGFVCLGKSALPEFGLNASTEPMHASPTRNPWHLDHSCGASSGGAAALVASGVVPIAHANDGGGSIRIPAACCGLVGLKPTRGRHVLSEAARAMPVNLHGEGVVTRSVRDTARFHAEAEKYHRDARLPPLGLVNGPSQRRLRIGLVIDSVTGAVTDAATRAAVEQAARLLADQGHDVEEVTIPFTPQFTDDFLVYWGFLAFALRWAGKRVIDPSFDRSKVDGLTVGLSRHFNANFHRLPGALRRLHRSRDLYAAMFKAQDVMLTPVVSHTTPKLGYLSPEVASDELIERLVQYAAFTPLANATGAPAISLPFASTDEGLPIAIQLWAAHGDERTLLELAFEVEQAKPWRKIFS